MTVDKMTVDKITIGKIIEAEISGQNDFWRNDTQLLKNTK
jgi:hypothetical protein